MHQRKIILQFSTSYYDFFQNQKSQKLVQNRTTIFTSYYDVTDFQSFNFESLSQQKITILANLSYIYVCVCESEREAQ